MYKFVVEDVIRNVREDFLNEGVEPDVLDQLQEVSSDGHTVCTCTTSSVHSVHTCTEPQAFWFTMCQVVC